MQTEIHKQLEKYLVKNAKDLKIGEKYFSFSHGIVKITNIEGYSLSFLSSSGVLLNFHKNLQYDKNIPDLYNMEIFDYFKEKEFPKMMEVSDDENFSFKHERKVVFKRENGSFVTDYKGIISTWKFAREIQPKQEIDNDKEFIKKFLEKTVEIEKAIKALNDSFKDKY